jgi:hypothetical protein
MNHTLRYLLPFAGLALAALLAQRSYERVRLAAVTRALDSAWTPVVLGVITALITWWAWGSLSQAAVYHDEAAYQLQASIFASGRWTAPAPPLPEFWEQMAVLVTPVLAPKMPPGHAIIMVPGIWLGLPGLPSVILSAITGALLFVLARRIAGGWVALVAWFIWLTAPRALLWRAAYFSEATTGVLWLASWWALLRWRETNRTRWLLALAAFIGWGAITRPLTMLVFAIPVGVVVLWTVVRRREWRALGMALALGTSILAILPLWSYRTTGSATTTPLALYTRQYMPWDVPGFGLDSTPSERPLPADLRKVESLLEGLHAEHTAAALPRIIWRRTSVVMHDIWPRWRSAFAILALIGLLVSPAAGWFAFATSVLLLLSYATYAHDPSWSVYYTETMPVLAFLTALGGAVVMRWMIASLRQSHEESSPAKEHEMATHLGLALTLILMLAPALDDLELVHTARQRETLYHRNFQQLTSAIPDSKAIVFVRYRPNHAAHFSLVRNVPDLSSAPVWVVYDRGEEDARLLRLAPDRAAYLYDDVRLAIVPLGDSTHPIARVSN